MEEVWVNIKDFPDYQISNFGRVKSFKINKNGIILDQFSDKNGYLIICLYENNNKKIKKIHRLVLESFIPILNLDSFECNHKDGNKKNNLLSNLEWCNRSENMNHAFQTGLQSLIGEKNTQSKLKNNEIIEIKKFLLSSKLKNNEIAKKFKVSPSTISDIKMGRTWQHIKGV